MITLTIGDYYDRCVDFFGDRTAITFGEQSYTYDEMGYKANCLLNAIQQMGLKKGDTVAFLMARRSRPFRQEALPVDAFLPSISICPLIFTP